MLAGGAAVLVVVLRRRSRMSADAFEADDDELDGRRRRADPACGGHREARLMSGANDPLVACARACCS